MARPRIAPNASHCRIPPGWRVDANAALRGFNVFDKHYVTTAYYNATQWLQGSGRRVELSVNYRF
ncbi:TonB-dependent receptor [Cupriavidus basilensis]|uniref:TonB-dependent receptor n=1 Tax=Cupriavidus basilensis TaxID=68895 RepID=A0A7M2HAF7_9BURK|nr:TonB-dependent receptor [Cupriavidus basilensis]QOT81535.1 TonB-dependent receptor [Cupriavidus basilensis]